jgi:hypothetical protein
MPRAAKHKLVFNEKLHQSGKGGGADALLRRLKVRPSSTFLARTR